MSTQENKMLIRRYFEEVLNQGKLEVVEELFAREYGSPEAGAAPHVRGPERAHRAALTMRSGFPDIHFTIREMIAEEDRVVVYVTFSGTHRGTFLGIPATGKKVEVNGAEEARLAHGRIVEEVWHLYDMLGLLEQLGAVSAHHG
jgi:steroid delta-isomerase-like uncharacterized protein